MKLIFRTVSLTENILIEQGRDTKIVSHRLSGVFPELGFTNLRDPSASKVDSILMFVRRSTNAVVIPKHFSSRLSRQ